MTTPMSCSISRTDSASSRRSRPISSVERLRLARVHAGRRLVEQEEPGLRRERARDLEPALVAVGQAARQVVFLAAETDECQQLARPRRARALPLRRTDGGRNTAPGTRRSEAAVLADQHVVEHRHLREEPDRLKGARDAPRDDRVRPKPDDGRALEDDAPAVRLYEPRDHVEERGLAGAVRADEPDHGASRHDEVDVVERHDAAEALVEPVDLEQRLCRRARVAVGCTSRSQPGIASMRGVGAGSIVI